MKTQGERVKDYFDRQGIKYSAAAEKMGIHVNTLRNWMAQETLTPQIFNRLANGYPSIMPEFDDNPIWDISITAITTTGEESLRAQEAAAARYAELMERYNVLLEKHVELQERMLEKQK